MWEHPDVFQHINETTTFRLGNMIDTMIFDSGDIDVGDYEYIYAGQYTRINCPDISADKIMSRTSELIDKSDTLDFIPEINYKSSILSYTYYHNVLLPFMILLVNKLPTNADFISDNLTNLKLLPSDDFNDLVLKTTSLNTRTVKSTRTVEEYQETIDREQECTDPENDIEDWLSIKIPLIDFEGKTDSPEYQRLLKEFGEATLTKYITKLKKYKKKSVPSEDKKYV